MSPMFDSIESAHEYVGLLLQTIKEATSEIDDVRQTSRTRSGDRGEVLRLIAYKLEQLQSHIDVSYRRLNDLRILRRMLDAGKPEAQPG